MSLSVDLYGTAYGNFAAQALEQVRRETYGEDFGQSSWVTGQEYRRFFRLLELTAADHVLDVGCGSGGPAVFLARELGCRVTGVDVNEAGIQAGLTLTRQAGLEGQIGFRRADVRDPLPFPAGAFDAIVCLDAMCHLPDRGRLLGEWRRVLRPGGRMLYTDPVVVTGLVSNGELATRSSTGYFEFCPPRRQRTVDPRSGVRAGGDRGRHGERGRGVAPLARRAAGACRRTDPDGRRRDVRRAPTVPGHRPPPDRRAAAVALRLPGSQAGRMTAAEKRARLDWFRLPEQQG